MKTDQLIEFLSNGAEPVARRTAERRLSLTVLLGGAGAAMLLLGVFGLNPQLRSLLSMTDFWVKMTFTGVLTVAALVTTWHLARPGDTVGGAMWWAVAAFVALWTIGADVLADAGSGHRIAALMGHTWRTCPFNIALLSAPIFVATAIALRSLAPTRLRDAGTAAGFFSGAFGAFVYGLHCPELAAPFIGTWYMLGIAIPTAIGAAFGPRWLSW
jgi:hypothetical protein